MRKKQKPGPVCPPSLTLEGPYRGGRACLTFRGWTVCPEVLGIPGSGRCASSAFSVPVAAASP